MNTYKDKRCPTCKTYGKIIDSKLCKYRVICLTCGKSTIKTEFLEWNK